MWTDHIELQTEGIVYKTYHKKYSAQNKQASFGLRVLWLPGGRLNKKDGLTRYGNFNVKDKTS